MAEKSAQEKLLYRDVLKYLTERNLKNGQEDRRWVFDKEDQKSVMEACHDEKLGGGQFGRDKTLQKICSRFYWQDMTNGRERTSELHPIPVSSIKRVPTIFLNGQKLKHFRQNVWQSLACLVPRPTMTKAQEYAANLEEKQYYDRKHARTELQLGDHVL
ncbi:hypothetical protein EMCRGX_G023378 [Ephydatia muelleri]